jgi:hypothetical protein
VTVGSFPTAASPEDLNEDGIQDVVLVTTGGGNLVTLLGQGAGGFGNGNFAAPVSVATGPAPVCLALLDVNGDGILDAVVGAQDDNSLYLHVGQGAAGVGNGTFGPAGLVATLEFSPTGIAVADYNEDGLLDLAIAGGGASIAFAVRSGRGRCAERHVRGTRLGGDRHRHARHPRLRLERDGITDLATSGTSVRLFYGNGTGGKGDGTFTPGPTYGASSTPNHLATADFNGDGITDLVVCNTGATLGERVPGRRHGGRARRHVRAGISVPAGTGPTPRPSPTGTRTAGPTSPSPATTAATSTSVLLGLGNGTFEAPQTFATGGKQSRRAWRA